MNTKQVIVIRKDLNMRKGKMIAQGSHASMAFITKSFSISQTVDSEGDPCFFACLAFTEEINHWLRNSFRKICVYVNSEEELEAVGFVDPGSRGCSSGGIPEPGTGVGFVVSLPVASSLSLLLLLDDDDEASPAKMFCVGCVVLRWL